MNRTYYNAQLYDSLDMSFASVKMYVYGPNERRYIFSKSLNSALPLIPHIRVHINQFSLYYENLVLY